ncbi:amine oxidase catalytic domain-containing protein [Marasmius fiardii PR-910]|nr:amine oxidase catalytic domain-containing protein [Marasmius fiardii PR-910]
MPTFIRSYFHHSDGGGSGYQPLPVVDDGNEKGNDHRNGDTKRHRPLTIRRVAVALMGFIFIYFVFRVVGLIRDHSDSTPSLKKPKLQPCSSSSFSHPSAAPAATPPAPVNLWSSLTIEETSEIQKWLEHPSRKLNLTRGKEAKPSDNTVFIIESYYPRKDDALTYLDGFVGSSNFTVKPPTKYARVTIHHGSDSTPVVKDYLVGPIPIGNGGETMMRELKEIYHRPIIPYNARGMVNSIEFTDAWNLFDEELRDVIEALLNATIRGLPSDTLVIVGSGPWSLDGSTRRLWTTFKKNVPGAWIQATGLYLYLDFSGTDTGLWRFLKVVYNNQYFNNTSAFVEAYHNGSLKHLPSPPPDGTWSSRKRRGSRRDLDHLPGPRAVSFAGKRFRVDKELGYVSWMGWGMYVGFDRDMGMSLWDIRFRGERVVYQLAPQEALAHYAGNDPVQSTTAWQDRYFGMGLAVMNMLPGYDCPHNGVFLPVTTWAPVGSFNVERAICVFEHDTESPLTRHSSYVDGEFGAVKGYVLVVRSIITIIFDYIFHLDGTMEVRVSASGYLQGGYWEPSQESYGGRIREMNMGNIHDHVINFKVDFDIGGTKNSLLATTTEEELVEHPWLDDVWGPTTVQQKVTKRYIENENDALLKYPPNFQGHFAIVNKDFKNQWGYPRGYIVHPGYNPVRATVVGNNKRTSENAHWAKYNLAVSKRKETEPSSSSMWNMNLPGAPVVDFHKFFDGEDITQEDLVVWVNVGTHHLVSLVYPSFPAANCSLGGWPKGRMNGRDHQKVLEVWVDLVSLSLSLSLLSPSFGLETLTLVQQPQAEDSPNTKMNTATSSFLLLPFNYFDHDVSMESTNAILLASPKIPGDPFTYDDYGVKQDYTCIPDSPEPFEYHDVIVFDVEGRKEDPKNAEEMREMKEMYHRMRVKMDL